MINIIQLLGHSGFLANLSTRRVTPLTRVFNILELLQITPICWLLNFQIWQPSYINPSRLPDIITMLLQGNFNVLLYQSVTIPDTVVKNNHNYYTPIVKVLLFMCFIGGERIM